MFAYSTVLQRVKLGEEFISFVSRNNYLEEFYEFTEVTGEDGVPGNGPITQHQAFCHRTSFNSHLPSYLLSLFLSRTNSVFLLIQIDSIHIPNVRKTLYSTSNIYHPKGNIVNYIFFTSLHSFCFLCGWFLEFLYSDLFLFIVACRGVKNLD